MVSIRNMRLRTSGGASGLAIDRIADAASLKPIFYTPCLRARRAFHSPGMTSCLMSRIFMPHDPADRGGGGSRYSL